MSLNVELKYGSENITSLDLTKKTAQLTTSSKYCNNNITVKLNVDEYNGEYYALQSIAITTPPTKTSYIQGETLDLTGMVVTATLRDGRTKVLTSSEYTTSPFNGMVLHYDDTQITVSYENKTATQAITVAIVSSIYINTYPTKTSYTSGEPLDLTGLVINASAGGDIVNVTNKCTFIPPAGTAITGSTTINVYYAYESTSFTVTTGGGPSSDS